MNRKSNDPNEKDNKRMVRGMRNGAVGGRIGLNAGQRFRPDPEGRGRQGHKQGVRHTAGNQHGNRPDPRFHSLTNQFTHNGYRNFASNLHPLHAGEPWYKYKTRPPITNDEKIKSEMCRNLLENGTCPYGVGCRFAHDEHELRKIMRHPKHKTQLCRDYHGEGHCTFGARCSYIHEQKEQSVSPQGQIGMAHFLHSSPASTTLGTSLSPDINVDADITNEYLSEASRCRSPEQPMTHDALRALEVVTPLSRHSRLFSWRRISSDPSMPGSQSLTEAVSSLTNDVVTRRPLASTENLETPQKTSDGGNSSTEVTGPSPEMTRGA